VIRKDTSLQYRGTLKRDMDIEQEAFQYPWNRGENARWEIIAVFTNYVILHFQPGLESKDSSVFGPLYFLGKLSVLFVTE